MYRLALMSREDMIDPTTLNEILGKEKPLALDPDADGDDGIGKALEVWLVREEPPSGTVYASALAAFEKP